MKHTIWILVVWALVILCAATSESEVFVLEDSSQPTPRQNLHENARLGDGLVDGKTQLRKEVAEVAMRKGERDLNKVTTVLRAARSTAQSRHREAQSEATSLSLTKAAFASKLEDGESSQASLEAIQSESAKEKSQLVTEEAGLEQALLLAKAREQKASGLLTSANQQLQEGGKRNEAAIVHAEQSLQQKALKVTLTGQARLTTRIEAEKLEMEAAAASRAATSKLADFGRQQRASRKQFEQELQAAHDKVDAAVSERGFARSKLVSATEESKRANTAAAVAAADVKRTASVQEDRIDQTSKKADQLRQQHQQDVAQLGNAKRQLRSSKSALTAAQDNEVAEREAVKLTGAALWGVKAMASAAETLQKKVDLEKRRLQLAEHSKARLLKEQTSTQVMLNSAKRGQIMAGEELGAVKDEKSGAIQYVDDARAVAKAGMKHSKELELAANTASTNENGVVGSLEEAAREMRKHRQQQLEDSKVEIRKQMKAASAALITAEGKQQVATVVSSSDQNTLTKAKAALHAASRKQGVELQEAERLSEQQIHDFTRHSEAGQAMVMTDSAETLETKLAKITSDLTMARAKKQEAMDVIAAGKKRSADAEVVKKEQVEQAKAEAKKTVQIAEAEHQQVKARDEKEVSELLQRAQRSQGEVSSQDPEAKAAAAAKLQAYAESAQKLADEDNAEMKAEKQQGEVLSESVTNSERQTEEEAERLEETSKSEAQRMIGGARLEVSAAQEEIGTLQDKQTKLKLDSASSMKKLAQAYQEKAKEQISASKTKLSATKASLDEDVVVAQRQMDEASDKAAISETALRLVQDEVQAHQQVLNKQKAEELKLLQAAHAQLDKANDEAQSQMQREKGTLGRQVTEARQEAVRAHDSVPRLRDSVVAARAALQQADEGTRSGAKQVEYHTQAAAGAKDELEQITLALPAAVNAQRIAVKRVADAVNHADNTLKTASGDMTTVKLKHGRAEAKHAAAVQKLADVNNAIATAETAEADAVATASEADHAATRAEADAVDQKGTAVRENAAAEAKAKKTAEAAVQTQKHLEAETEAEKAGALKHAEASGAADAAKKALDSYDLSALKDFTAKQRELSVDVDAAQEKSKASAKLDADALKLASDALLAKQQAEAGLIQAKDHAKAGRLIAVATKDSAGIELEAARGAIIYQNAHLASFRDNALTINADYATKVTKADERNQDIQRSANRQKQDVAEENTVWLKADGKNDKAYKAFRTATDQMSEAKDTFNAAKREDTDATRALDEAQASEDADKREKFEEEVKEARLRAKTTTQSKDEAVQAAETSEQDLPKELLKTRQDLNERTSKARKKHKHRLRGIRIRSIESVAVASKNTEIANSMQIQAEMDAEKADEQAVHVAKLTAQKIEAARVSATKGVELAKRRSEAAQQRLTTTKEEAQTASKQRDINIGETEKAVQAQQAAQIDHSSAADAERVTLEARDATLDQRNSDIETVQQKQHELQTALAVVQSQIDMWDSRVKGAEDDAIVASAKATRADLSAKEHLLKAQFETTTARARSAANERTARDAASAVEEQAQMQLDAVEQKASVELDLARNVANEREGMADQLAIQEVRDVEAASAQEMQKAEGERIDALSRWQAARDTLTHAREMRSAAATMKQTYELEGKKHQHDTLKFRKQTRIDEKRIKGEEREADTKHKAKLHQMELDQKAIAKAKAAELAAKEKWTKSTLAPTQYPTNAPTESPSIAPTNLPTVAPTIPPLCRNATGFREIAPKGHCADLRYPSTGTENGDYDDISDTADGCSLRCQAKIPDTTSFYLKGTQCGCSATTAGACDVSSDSSYTSYEIIIRTTPDVLQILANATVDIISTDMDASGGSAQSSAPTDAPTAAPTTNLIAQDLENIDNPTGSNSTSTNATKTASNSTGANSTGGQDVQLEESKQDSEESQIDSEEPQVLDTLGEDIARSTPSGFWNSIYNSL